MEKDKDKLVSDEFREKLEENNENMSEWKAYDYYSKLKMKHDQIMTTLTFLTSHMNNRPRDAMAILKIIVDIDKKGYNNVMHELGRRANGNPEMTDTVREIAKDKMR